eukprot:959773-Prymnesium_polylepis.2
MHSPRCVASGGPSRWQHKSALQSCVHACVRAACAAYQRSVSVVEQFRLPIAVNFCPLLLRSPVTRAIWSPSEPEETIRRRLSA